MPRKSCELCDKPARMLCESDQASLCFPCDERVHAANFLVAKHSRTLLCHVCGSPTPWSAQGTGIGPTVSVCGACSGRRRRGGCVGADDVSATGGDVASACNMDDDDATSTSNGSLGGEGSYSDEESDGYGEEEEGENQVVPGSEEDATWQSGGGGGPETVKAKEEDEESSSGAKRLFHDDCDNDNGYCSSPEINSSGQESDERSDDTFASRPSKIRRKNGSNLLMGGGGIE